MTFDVDSAIIEVSSKTDETIDKETAYAQASRAVACFQLFVKTDDKKWLLRVNGYVHEALEHAALVRDQGETVREIENEIDRRFKEIKGA